MPTYWGTNQFSLVKGPSPITPQPTTKPVVNQNLCTPLLPPPITKMLTTRQAVQKLKLILLSHSTRCRTLVHKNIIPSRRSAVYPTTCTAAQNVLQARQLQLVLMKPVNQLLQRPRQLWLLLLPLAMMNTLVILVSVRRSRKYFPTSACWTLCLRSWTLCWPLRPRRPPHGAPTTRRSTTHTLLRPRQALSWSPQLGSAVTASIFMQPSLAVATIAPTPPHRPPEWLHPRWQHPAGLCWHQHQ